MTNFIGAILNHPVVIEFLAEIVVKFEVKPYERKRKRQRERETERDRETEREAFTLKAIVKIFQSQGYCSEVLSV